MTSWVRLFAGFFVGFCIMELVQMATVEIEHERIRRDSPPEENKGESIFKQAEEQFNKYLNDEKTQEFLKQAASTFSEFTKGIETQLNSLKDKFATENEKKLETK